MLQLPTDMRFAELAMRCPAEIARRRIPAEQERQLAVLLHHLISGAPLSEAMERQAAESGIPFGMSAYPDVDTGDAPDVAAALCCTRQKSAAGLGRGHVGRTVGGWLSAGAGGDDLFALEMPLRGE